VHSGILAAVIRTASVGTGGAPRWSRAALLFPLWRWRSAGLLLSSLLLLAAICGATAGDDGFYQFDVLKFDIPSQPLMSALQQYSQVSGVQVLYESSSSYGRRSVAVEGDYTRDAALRQLLSDTDLIVYYTHANAITLAPPSVEGTDLPPLDALTSADLVLDTLHVQPEPRDTSRLRDYSKVIENDVEQALKKHPGTKVGNYRVGIRLWIDQQRTIRRTELFHSSGDDERDATIARILDGLVISQSSPPNTPQPVVLMISVNSL
jgi:hypothetical protein